MKAKPTILLYIEDLFFISRVEYVLDQLGCHGVWLHQLEPPLNLVHAITRHQPDLVILDLNLKEYDLQNWILEAKADLKHVNIPILAFGSHKDIETMKAIKEAGADQVVAKSRFVSDMQKLILKFVGE